MYRITEGNLDTLSCRDNGICIRRYSFMWLKSRACFSSLLCTKLNGGNCQSYGVSFLQRGKDGTTMEADKICSPFKLYSSSILSSNLATIEVWYKKGVNFLDASCYFWCTDTGTFPTPSSDANIDQALATLLVRPASDEINRATP